MLLFDNMTYLNKSIGFVKVKWPQRLKFYSIVLIHCKFQFKKANFFFAYKADTISSFECNNGFYCYIIINVQTNSLAMNFVRM